MAINERRHFTSRFDHFNVIVSLFEVIQKVAFAKNGDTSCWRVTSHLLSTEDEDFSVLLNALEGTRGFKLLLQTINYDICVSSHLFLLGRVRRFHQRRSFAAIAGLCDHR